MAEKLSLTDYKLLNYLLEHDLHNYSRIAKDTKIPASTIYDRIRALRRKGVIKRVVPELDLEKLGYGVFASLEIELNNLRDAEEIHGKFQHHKNVVGLFKMSGNYDMLMLAIFKSPLELERLINKLLALPEVKDVHGNLSIRTYKFGQCPMPVEEE